ncbi:acyl-CoA synthetase (AMP-forming)/AMP-acid ligase II [Bradyrhizobium sp. LM6.11]
MTETNMNTSNPYDGERVPGAVGFPLPGVSVRVTDPETAKELPREEIGMIEVKGPNVFKGYWRMPEKTKAEFRDDGFFITGDLGKIDAKGYVHILGRGKDLVISGGFNVYPKEIESEIDAMPGVIESAVIGVPHADFGEGVTAVLVCNKGADVSEAAVLKALDGRLAKVQDAQARLCRRRAAAQHHGQGAEEYFAGYVQGSVREEVRGSSTLSPSLRAKRSNPDCRCRKILDCFAALAMTEFVAPTAHPQGSSQTGCRQ